jgi:hypothetical protein
MGSVCNIVPIRKNYDLSGDWSEECHMFRKMDQF